METLHRAVEQVSRWGAWFGGALLVASVLAISAEVLIRGVFGRSFGGVDELTGYALAISSAWAFGFALVHRAHIRIDTVYMLLPAWVRAVLDLVALAGIVAFFGLVLWFGWDLLARSYTIGQRAMTPLRTPLIFPQALWFAGIAVFVLLAAILFARSAAALLRGDMKQVRDLAGSKTAQDELEEELAEAAARRRG